MKKGNVNNLESFHGVLALTSSTFFCSPLLGLLMLSTCGMIAAYVEESCKWITKIENDEVEDTDLAFLELDYINYTVNFFTVGLLGCIVYTNTQVPLVMSMVQTFIFGLYISQYWLQYKIDNTRVLNTYLQRKLGILRNRIGCSI